MEMEASTFLAYCNRGNVAGAVICAILVNRLERDQLTCSHDELSSFANRLMDVVIKVTKCHLKIPYRINIRLIMSWTHVMD